MSAAAPNAAHHDGWELIPCPVCGGSTFVHLFDKAGEPIVRCHRCGLTLINPRPPATRIRARYDSDYSALYVRKAQKKLRRARRRVRRLAREYGVGGRWLDVGCSAGFVVKAAEEAGFEAHGVDIEAGAVAWGRRELGLANLRAGLLAEQRYAAGGFDVISVYDVIEHVPDLTAFVAELKRLLAPAGVIEIGTPDIGHWRVPARLETWHEVKPSEHLYYFDRRTLARLLAQGGLRVVRARFSVKPALKICAVHA